MSLVDSFRTPRAVAASGTKIDLPLHEHPGTPILLLFHGSPTPTPSATDMPDA